MELYKELLDCMSDGVYFVDRERRILYWNEGAAQLTGYSAAEVLGRRCQDNLLCHVDGLGHPLCLDGCPLSACLADGGSHDADVFLRHKQGRRVPVNVRVQPIRDADGTIVGAVEIFRDNTAQIEARRKAEAMERLAFLDTLTQLPNRRFLEMSLRTGLMEYEAGGDPLGVLVFDLNRFKAINDRCGHSSGDRALVEAARTLAGALRAVDIVGRWGGDEFLAIAHSVSEKVLQELAERCTALVGKTTFRTDCGSPNVLSISVGCALARPDDDAAGLVARADVLMYANKRQSAALAWAGSESARAANADEAPEEAAKALVEVSSVTS